MMDVELGARGFLRAMLPALVLTVLLAGCGGRDADVKQLAAPPAEGDRWVEQAGGFSLVLPKGWDTKKIVTLDYPLILGPRVNNFQPNINFVDDLTSKSLDEYVADKLKRTQKRVQAFRVVGQTDFVTAAGVRGRKVIFTDEQEGTALRQISYFLAKQVAGEPPRKMTITATALAEDGEKWDATFESTVATFRWESELASSSAPPPPPSTEASPK